MDDGRVTAREFSEADDLGDWRVLFSGPLAFYRTRSFGAGAALVGAIAAAAREVDHYPDVDLRPDGVTVRLRQAGRGLTARDVELARRISVAAREQGVPADPAVLQHLQLTIDALVSADVMPFWRAVLGYLPVGDEDLVDPHARGPALWFQDMDAPRPQRNRIHVDLSLPHDQAEARVAAALAAGGRLVSDANAPSWWALADAEGNEVDIATWQGRD